MKPGPSCTSCKTVRRAAAICPLQSPLWIEAPVLIAVTIGSCWIGYEIVRRVGVLRPLFGLKMEPKRIVAT